MSIQVVNGFQCRNCTDIDYAKKHIDPAHPKDGPYGIYAKDHPATAAKTPSVILGGALAATPSAPIGARPTASVGASGVNIVV